ncbi:MAG: DNA replication and repair protein RecF [Spirochaetia bacterium]|jgi:DNA replication and repair protein RecF|nr:DNA replication and repair protein RecF [Spirochaetia bacterium]
MYISRLNLKTFRNYESAVIDFAPNINFITGSNGSGKTNILEAISILANIKSFRNIPDTDIAKWKSTAYYASAEIAENECKKFEVGFSSESNKNRKKVKIDDIEIKKVSDYYGKFLVVVISPGDISIINDGPEIRRRFFDSAISKIDIDYFEKLNDFRKAVINRNSLLKQLRERKVNDAGQLDPWDVIFAEKAAYIVKKREDFINRFREIFTVNYCKIASDDDAPDMEYINTFGVFDESAILKKLKERRLKDILIGNCGKGPHRDDFMLKKTEGIHFVNYASQGQRRTAAIALKISEYDIMREKLEKEAVILVDDIFSELDEKRRKNMVKLLNSGNQVIFTMVNINSVEDEIFFDSKKYEIRENFVYSF